MLNSKIFKIQIKMIWKIQIFCINCKMKIIHFTIELECLADSQDLFVLESDVEKIMMNRTYFILMIKNKKKSFLCKNAKNRTFLQNYISV